MAIVRTLPGIVSGNHGSLLLSVSADIEISYAFWMVLKTGSILYLSLSSANNSRDCIVDGRILCSISVSADCSSGSRVFHLVFEWLG